MTLQELQTKANTKLGAVWDVIITKQEAYWNKHQTFFGFNWTPANPVVDGVDTNMGEVQRPSRKHHAADVSFPATTKLPFQIQILRHVGDEHGFTATVRVELPNGKRYSRSRTAYPVIQPATYDNTDELNPVELTPATITDWVIDTTAWALVEEEI